MSFHCYCGIVRFFLHLARVENAHIRKVCSAFLHFSTHRNNCTLWVFIVIVVLCGSFCTLLVLKMLTYAKYAPLFATSQRTEITAHNEFSLLLWYCTVLSAPCSSWKCSHTQSMLRFSPRWALFSRSKCHFLSQIDGCYSISFCYAAAA